MKKQCRMCKSSKLTPFLDMGIQPIVNGLLSKKDIGKKEIKKKLVVSLCKDCGLVQIVDNMPAKVLYKDIDYLYFASDMPGQKQYFQNYYDKSIKKYLGEEDFVVEIGSNDGILLDIIFTDTERETTTLGVDPSSNVVIRALARGIPTLSEFFTEDVARKIKNEMGKAKVITGNNCIAHVEDLNDLMRGIDMLLADDGVFIFEANYWVKMMETTNYSMIYHDHYSCFTFDVWHKFLKKYGMEIIDASTNMSMGGSMRVTIARTGKYTVSKIVDDIAECESLIKAGTIEECKKFASSVKADAKKLHKIVDDLVKSGKKIVGYGAAAKGFTVLNMANITNKHLGCIIDDSPAKQNYYTPINHIKVVSRDEANETKFDYILILPWNYKDIIMKKEAVFKACGGKFIIPVGEVGIV